jgi:hypothetical protein
MAIVAAFTMACGSEGITEASTTRSPSTPCTLSAGSTTAAASMPIRQVPTGRRKEFAARRAKSRRPWRSVTSGRPGKI